jgi:heme oxygenase
MTDACNQAAIRLGALALAAAQDARLEALKADLAVFGCVPSPAGAAAPRSDDFAVGVLYTVLGSTLGGKVIHRQLEALLADGRSFFKGSAEDGANWQLFCRRLEDAGLDMAQVEAGALHAFAAFKSMLNESEFAVACE